MKRLGLLALIVGTLMAIAAPTAAAQSAGPTYGQLHRALLTEDDLWESDIDFLGEEIDAGELELDYPAVYADFIDNSTDDFLAIELHDARNGVPDDIAIDLADDITDGLDVTEWREITPTGYGSAGVRYRYIYDEGDGDRWYGEVAAWRQGRVVVAILVESLDPEACVCDFAKLQYDKVAAMIP